MSILPALYAQNPASLWLAAGALLIVLELATGSGRLFRPALATLPPAALDSLRPPPGAPADLFVFAVALVLAGAAAWRLRPRLSEGAKAERRPATWAAAWPAFKPRRAKTTRSHGGLNLASLDDGSSAEPPTVAAAPEPPQPVERLAAPPPEPRAPPRPTRPPAPPIVQRAPPAPKPPRRTAAPPPPPVLVRPTPAPVTDPAATRRLVGRIARSTGDFANGVGRVWIENAEWAADLEYADELAADQPVKVVGVAGALRLRVVPLIVE